MAGKRVVHVWREHLAASSAFRSLGGRMQGDYLKTMVLLSTTEEGNPLRGCLCVGKIPMTFDEWKVEMKYRKRIDAERSWDRLHEVGLLQSIDVGGIIFACVSRFGENQDRMKKRPGTYQGVRERTGKKPGSAREAHGKRTGSAHTTVENKGVTQEKTRTSYDRSRSRSYDQDRDLDHIHKGDIGIDQNSPIDIKKGGLKRRRRRRKVETDRTTACVRVGDVLRQPNPTTNIGESEYCLMTSKELIDSCAALERNLDSGSAMRMWRKRVKELEAIDADLYFLRDALKRIYNSKHPENGKDVGEFKNPAAWLNKQTMELVKQTHNGGNESNASTT